MTDDENLMPVEYQKTEPSIEDRLALVETVARKYKKEVHTLHNVFNKLREEVFNYYRESAANEFVLNSKITKLKNRILLLEGDKPKELDDD